MTHVSQQVFTKADYENDEIYIGKHFNEDGEPLVVVGGKCIGPVRDVMHIVSQYQCPPKALPNMADIEARLDALIRSIPAQVIQCVRKAQRANALR